MEEIKSDLKSQISKILDELGVSGVEAAITIPQDLTHGDYTTNVAFSAFSSVKGKGLSAKSPFELAQLIASRFALDTLPFLEKVEAIAPGFINFKLSKTLLGTQLNSLLSAPEKVGRSTKMESTKVIIEFTDPNPFKEFHIGHLYTNTVGESLSRLFESQGATVWRADYFGDVGMHIAKSIFGILQKFKDQNSKFKNLEDLKNVSLKERIKFMGEAYALGSTAYEESDRAKEDIKHLNKLIYIVAQRMWEKEKGMKPQIDYQKEEQLNEKEVEMVYTLYTTGRTWSLEYFDSIYARVGMKFNGYYPESIAGERGYKLVRDHIKDGIFEESDGAIVFRGETHSTRSASSGQAGSGQNLHTRVFINSLGLPTYEAKELGLAPWKYEDFPYDKSIIVTGNEIKEYFKVLIAAMTAINPDLGQKTLHLPHGMVRLPEGKMSSRTGKIITGEWLINEAVKKAEEMSKKDVILSDSEGSSQTDQHLINDDQLRKEDSSAMPQNDNSIAEQVGIGAIKYAFLKSGIGKDIEFDFETSLSLNGNSGPYLQYTYVRTQSILAKALSVKGEGESNYSSSPSTSLARTINLSPEEETLLRMLIHFAEVVSTAAETLAPSTVATYLYELAKAFNLFYQKQRIVDAPSKQEREFRVSLTSAVGTVLRAGLHLLGIEAPKKM